MQHNTILDLFLDIWEAARDSHWTWKAVAAIVLITGGVLALLHFRK